MFRYEKKELDGIFKPKGRNHIIRPIHNITNYNIYRQNFKAGHAVFPFYDTKEKGKSGMSGFFFRIFYRKAF